MSSEPVVQLKGVWKKYSKLQVMNNSLREDFARLLRRKPDRSRLERGEFWALKNIDLEIGRGECLGLSGHNGCGKSTTLKLISYVTSPTMGEVSCRGRVAPLIELGAGFHPDLSGMENIYMNGTILGFTIRDVKKAIPAILEFSGLQEFIDVPVKKYSSGMYLRLAFAIAVHSPADIFLFDEVISVGDAQFQARCFEKMNELKAQGKTIVIVSHDQELLEQRTDRVVRLQGGEICG
ncbi:MAG TPA: ABC transporter ATP-binding protein [Geomonas sp.]|nr:ABC transporter ATP-binding protein [Geomonas sp.]